MAVAVASGQCWVWVEKPGNQRAMPHARKPQPPPTLFAARFRLPQPTTVSASALAPAHLLGSASSPRLLSADSSYKQYEYCQYCSPHAPHNTQCSAHTHSAARELMMMICLPPRESPLPHQDQDSSSTSHSGTPPPAQPRPPPQTRGTQSHSASTLLKRPMLTPNGGPRPRVSA